MTHAPLKCEACGAGLPADAPQGLCPQCLLRSDVLTPSPTLPSAPSHCGPAAAPGREFGSYRILRLLGRGGMGEVFEADHLPTGRRVALKVMNHTLASESDRKRFLREGRLAASINHPNVVHIHSGEEVCGVPVIAMELVRGGTLADRLRTRGQLPPAEAAQLVIQIIAGLEAAQGAGILHRDIKPANCFLDADGTVKVGDFGLSVSTFARGESLVTARGTVLGTPAYASPEQLRGETLTSSTDLYSLGATLYHLVTGRPPFAADDLVQLLSQVLDRNPVPPQTLRPDLPAGLSSLILRCLAKDPAARPRSYEELRNALLPFTRHTAEPAPRHLRFLANLLDEAIAALPALVVTLVAGLDPLDLALRDQTAVALAGGLAALAWSLAYYGVCEGCWGAGLGKLACGLRVVNPDQQPPGIPRALLRAALFHAPTLLATLFTLATMSGPALRESMLRGGEPASSWLSILLFPCLFVTMRRRNGWAALHELASHTRVVLQPRSHRRTTLADLRQETGLAIQPGFGPATDKPQPHPDHFGPYVIQTPLVALPDESLYLAHDPLLRRAVWIHSRPLSNPPLPPARQALGRPARLRWLNHGTADSVRWDAYEAIEGIPLLSLDRPVPWHVARHWLLDIARELAHPDWTQESPPTDLAAIWIATSGRAFLLDNPCLQALAAPQPRAASPSPEETVPAQLHQRFLDRMARRLLEGPHQGPPDISGGDGAPQAPVPLRARDFLQKLARGVFERPEIVAGNLESLAHRAARVSPARRAAAMLLAPTSILLFSILLSLAVHLDTWRTQRTWAAAFPHRPHLASASRLYVNALSLAEAGRQPPTSIELIRAYLVDQYRDVITNEAFWNNPALSLGITTGERALLLQAVLGHAAPTPATVQESRGAVETAIQALEEGESVELWFMVVVVGLVAAALCAAVTCLMACRGSPGPGLRLVGLAVVDQRGQPAKPLRLLARWTLVSSFLCLVLLLGLGPLLYSGLSTGPGNSIPDVIRTLASPWAIAPLALGLLSLVFAAIYTVRHPARCWADRLAGTRVVLQ